MNGQMKHIAIGTVPFGNASHTAANIGERIKSIFNDFGVNDEILFQSSLSTSDCARNIVLALNNVSFPSDCANHRFATSSQVAWNHISLLMPEAKLLMDNCNSLVTFLKQSTEYYVRLTHKVKK